MAIFLSELKLGIRKFVKALKSAAQLKGVHILHSMLLSTLVIGGTVFGVKLLSLGYVLLCNYLILKLLFMVIVCLA